jgi:hypothetical protein
MTPSLIFTRNAWTDKPIRVGTGDDAGHVGIGLGPLHVIDTTFWHGCKLWDRAEWLSHRTLVDEIEVPAASLAHAREAEDYVLRAAAENWRYDWLEIVGFILMRELGDPQRGVCSSLARTWFELHTGHQLRTRLARTSPRHMRIAAGAYLAGSATAPQWAAPASA